MTLLGSYPKGFRVSNGVHTVAMGSTLLSQRFLSASKLAGNQGVSSSA